VGPARGTRRALHAVAHGRWQRELAYTPDRHFNVLPPGGAFTTLSPTSHTTDANIQISYTLFGGGQSLSRVRAARAAESAARANDDAVHSRLASRSKRRTTPSSPITSS